MSVLLIPEVREIVERLVAELNATADEFLGSRSGAERGVEIVCPAGRAWLYMGRSFDLDRRIQRQRIDRNCGYVHFAYGRARHFGRPARRTIGFQIEGLQ